MSSIDIEAAKAELAALDAAAKAKREAEATAKVDAIALPFKTFDQCREASRKRWLIKGVLAEDECSSWFGKPDSGKSSIWGRPHPADTCLNRGGPVRHVHWRQESVVESF
jgi:hypothetical protein